MTSMFRYGAIVFLAAFLLFLVQPLVARFLLPWFGGGPAVWTVCMLFFQAALLAGYAYAHASSERLRPESQARVHAVVVAASLLALPLLPEAPALPGGDGSPTARILEVLLLSIGAPFFVLASTSPLLQRWFSREPGLPSPYRLYALSNAGSLLALIAYPFVIEPLSTLHGQALAWTIAYGAFAVLTVALAVAHGRRAHDPVPVPAASPVPSELEPGPSAGVRTYWLALPATASALLLATTNQLCIDVAVVPFLWVLPLALYLLSFVLCFDHPRWYDRRLFVTVFAASSAAAAWMLARGADIPVEWLVLALSAALFSGCMVLHGELVAIRPGPGHLTRFYLSVAAGGVVGGLFVALLAPATFDGFWEYPVALVATGALAVSTLARSGRWGAPSSARFWTAILVSAVQVHGFVDFVLAPQRAAGQASDTAVPDPSVVVWTWLALSIVHLGAWTATAWARERERTTIAVWIAAAVLHGGVVHAFASSVDEPAFAPVAPWLVLGWSGVAVGLGVLWARAWESRLAPRVRRIVTVGLLHAVLLALLAILAVVDAVPTSALLVVGVALVGIDLAALRAGRGGDRGRAMASLSWGPVAAAVLLLALRFVSVERAALAERESTHRDFYGVLSVTEDESVLGRYRLLTHGRIDHGFQYLEDSLRTHPTSYYGPGTGLALALERMGALVSRDDSSGALRLGVVGLGVGTIAAYGREGDALRFYEINPTVAELAATRFSYLGDSRAAVDVVIGDARISLERERAVGAEPPFDVLVVDAFSSDAIPIHLVTREAVELYRDRLAPGGAIIFHTSNRFLDLDPVIRGLASHLGWNAFRFENGDDEPSGVYESTWAVITGNERFAEDERVRTAAAAPSPAPPIAWTDDYASLWQVLRF